MAQSTAPWSPVRVAEDAEAHEGLQPAWSLVPSGGSPATQVSDRPGSRAERPGHIRLPPGGGARPRGGCRCRGRRGRGTSRGGAGARLVMGPGRSGRPLATMLRFRKGSSRFEFEFEIRVRVRIRIRDSRFEIRDSRFEIRDSRFEIRDSRFEIRDSRFEIRDSSSPMSRAPSTSSALAR